jgi:anti-sigma B factor antagonist
MLPQGIELEQAGAVVKVSFGLPEITHNDMQEAMSECLERLRYSNAQNFILDFAGVEFLASACIGALVAFMQDVEHVRGRIVLANCQDNVSFLFKVTRLDHVFEMFEDAEAAAAAL